MNRPEGVLHRRCCVARPEMQKATPKSGLLMVFGSPPAHLSNYVLGANFRFSSCFKGNRGTPVGRVRAGHRLLDPEITFQFEWQLLPDANVRFRVTCTSAVDPMLPVVLLYSRRSYPRLFTWSTLIRCNYGTVHALQMWPWQRHAIPKVALILP